MNLTQLTIFLFPLFTGRADRCAAQATQSSRCIGRGFRFAAQSGVATASCVEWRQWRAAEPWQGRQLQSATCRWKSPRGRGAVGCVLAESAEHEQHRRRGWPARPTRTATSPAAVQVQFGDTASSTWPAGGGRRGCSGAGATALVTCSSQTQNGHQASQEEGTQQAAPKNPRGESRSRRDSTELELM